MSAAVDVEKIADVADAKVNDDLKSKANTATADKAATDKATPEKAVAAADNGTTKEVTEKEDDVLSNISENTLMYLERAAKRPMGAYQKEEAAKKAKIDKVSEYDSEDGETIEELDEEESDLDDSEEYYGPFDEEEECEDENAGADADEDEENDDDSGSGYDLA